MVLMAFLARMTRSGEMKTTRTRTRQPHTCASMDWYSSSSPSSLHIGWRWEKRMSGRINLRIAFPSLDPVRDHVLHPGEGVGELGAALEVEDALGVVGLDLKKGVKCKRFPLLAVYK